MAVGVHINQLFTLSFGMVNRRVHEETWRVTCDPNAEEKEMSAEDTRS